MLRPWTMPEPLLPVAIEARAKADEDKLGPGLQRLAAEDPTLRIEHNAETHQIVLWTHGRGARRRDPRPAREPARRRRRPGRAEGAAAGDVRRPGRRPGPARQAVRRARAVRRLPTSRSSRCPAGRGFEFVDKVVGGSVPRQFIPSVEKGVRAQMETRARGRLPGRGHPGHPADGKSHSVDSSDMAFQTAGGAGPAGGGRGDAHRACSSRSTRSPCSCPDDLVGTVMSDLSGRRGRVLGSEPAGDDRTLVRAEVPQVEIGRYSIDLRAFIARRRVVHPQLRALRADARRRRRSRRRRGGRLRSSAGARRTAQRGSAGWIASIERDARCASQWSTSSSYAARPISSVSSGALVT